MVYNYYKLLGISIDATPTEIKKAYRVAAKKYHPDVSKSNQDSSELFSVINQGYDILMDKRKRSSYDFLLAHEQVKQEEALHPFADKVSEKRRHRYSKAEILKRKKKAFEIQRQREQQAIINFRKKAQVYSIKKRYILHVLVILTGLFLGYNFWFVNYLDELNFLMLFIALATTAMGILYTTNLAYNHMFILSLIRKKKVAYERMSVLLMTGLILCSFIVFSAGVKFKRYYELKYNFEYAYPLVWSYDEYDVEFMFEVNNERIVKRISLETPIEPTDKLVVRYSKSNPRIADIIALNE